MKWPDFLRAISGSEGLTLVGPLYEKSHELVEPTIYVDGGARFRVSDARAEIPSVAIGDGDSGAIALDELLSSEKDYSDLAFALRGVPDSVSRVSLLGFLGGRRDHELCNLGEVHAFLSRRPHFTQVEIIGDGTRMVAFCKGRVHLNIHGMFSVFVFEATALKILGACKYPLARDRVIQPLSSVGLSNEGSGLIEIESGSPAFVILPASQGM